MNKLNPNLRPFGRNGSCGGILAAGLLIFIGLLAADSWYTAKCEQYRYDHNGIQVGGIVIRHTSKIGKKSTTYYLNYQYFDSNGFSHIGSDAVSSSQWAAIRDKTPVQVIYLMDDPDSSILAGSTEFKGAMLGAGFIAIMLAVFGSILLYMTHRHSVKRSEVLKNGIETIAQAQSIQTLRKGGSRLIYEYGTEDGQIIVGYDDLSRAEKSEWEMRLQMEDNAIPLVYNRFRPSDHTIIGFENRLRGERC